MRLHICEVVNTLIVRGEDATPEVKTALANAALSMIDVCETQEIHAIQAKFARIKDETNAHLGKIGYAPTPDTRWANAAHPNGVPKRRSEK